MIRASVHTVARAWHLTHGKHPAPLTRQAPRHPPGWRPERAGTHGGCDAPVSCGNQHRVGLLEISVAAGQTGPVLSLSGEADITTAAELTEALSAQLATGTRCLTVDLSRLRFADSAAIRALVLADRTLKGRGGGLALAHPQPGVARVLRLLGVDQAIEVRDGMSAGADPEH